MAPFGVLYNTLLDLLLILDVKISYTHAWVLLQPGQLDLIYILG